MEKFKKANSAKSITVFATVGALVGSGTIGSVKKVSAQQDWIATDGATGKVNLDAVKDALETSQDLSEFEKRVNEIYEGDNLVLIMVEEEGTQIIISGFEDLNQSNAIEEAQDEKLFSIIVDEEKYEVYGYSTNDYYYYGSDYGDGADYNYSYSDKKDKLFMYWLLHKQHSTSDRIMYQPSRKRAAQMQLDRDRFRSSSAYAAQRRANQAFFTQQQARNPQAFRSSTKNVPSQRSTYRQKQMSRIEATRSARSGSSMRPGS